MMIVGSRAACKGKPSVTGVHWVILKPTMITWQIEKKIKFSLQKAVTNATFRILFCCLEKRFADFIAVQDFKLDIYKLKAVY